MSSDPMVLAREFKPKIRSHVELKGLFNEAREEAAGFAWENMHAASIHGCFPGNFPTIDDLRDDGSGKMFVATSFKTMNTYACYEGLASDTGKDRFWNVIKDYINDLADFSKHTGNLIQRDGAGPKQVEVNPDRISKFCLSIAVPLEDSNQNQQYITQFAAQLNSQGLRHKKTGAPIEVSFTFVKDIWLPSPGYLFEIAADSKILGQAAGNFKAIDSYRQSQHGNRSTSLKIVDIRRHYDGADGPKRLLTTLSGYLKALEDFRKSGYKERGAQGRQIKPDEVGAVCLCIAMPEGYSRDRFDQALFHFFKEAHDKGIEVEIMLAPD